MLLITKYLNLIFFLKKVKKTKQNLQINSIYSIFKNLIFFLLTIYKFKLSIPFKINKVQKHVFKIKTFNKNMFSLVILEIINSIKCLKFIKSYQLSNLKKKLIKHTLLRSPFVFKNSREQLCFEEYTGNVSIIQFQTKFMLTSNFIETIILNFLKHFLLTSIKIKKCFY